MNGRRRSRRGAPRSTGRGVAAESADGDWIHGVHAVRLMVERAPRRIRRLLIRGERGNRRLVELGRLAEAQGLAIEQADDEVLSALAPGLAHQGAMALVTIPQPMDEYALQALVERTEMPLLLVLDGVQDPRNLGACLRCADAAGVHAVVLPRRRAAPLTATAIKAASGAAASVPIAQVVNVARVLRWLKAQGVRVVGTTGDARLQLWQADFGGALALVMGGEAQGLRQLTLALCDQQVSLPMSGVVESLNVSVATGICLYEAVRQRQGQLAGGSRLPPA